ncbi:uncharacterized protein LOC108904657 [Anoplophora glabripennis]|uniref:uncharacterized protein LOC108904657 n=1 Tax=Anoplophora glabripennis TaxID=217634 RepID=UPI000C7894CE|nr:uncharacterized protein LOC108904657 [Anoplophora glabripennis]
MLKIFREQATILQGEIISLISTVHIPTGIGYAAADLTETGIFETPPTPIAKIKTKRARKVITETPEILQDRTDQMFLQLSNVEDILQQPTARADEISIREEMPKQTEPIEDDFSLGVRSRKEIEEDMQMLFTKTKDIPIVHPQYPSSDSQPLQNLIEVVAQVHAPKDGFIEDLQALQQPPTDENFSATVPVPRIDLESERLTEHISEVESASVLQPVPTEGLSLGKEVHPSTELLEVVQTGDIPPAVEIEIDLPREAAKMSKKTKRERKQLVELQVNEVALRSQQIAQKRGNFKVKHAGKRIVGINRCNVSSE